MSKASLAISEATGLPKSSVGRHKQGIARRAQYPESSWWETEVVLTWLKLFVLGVVYYFGIKQGIGAESLEEFFKAMRWERHVACSATTWRSLKKKMREAIVAYGMTQADSAAHGCATLRSGGRSHALSTVCGSGPLRGGR